MEKYFIEDCRRCLLYKTRKNIVWGDGNLRMAKYLMIGEAPGKTEDEIGRPFIGKSGKHMRNELISLYGERIFDDLFITNMIMCRPPNNRNPSQYEITKCSIWLRFKIKSFAGNKIICIGRIASENIIDENFEWGEIYTKEEKQYIGIYHPSFCIRNLRNELIQNNFKNWFNKIMKD